MSGTSESVADSRGPATVPDDAPALAIRGSPKSLTVRSPVKKKTFGSTVPTMTSSLSRSSTRERARVGSMEAERNTTNFNVTFAKAPSRPSLFGTCHDSRGIRTTESDHCSR